MSPRLERPCGNPECCTSTTIAETLSYGSGELDSFGFWEKPCRVCAAHFEALDRAEGYTEYMPYWPRAEDGTTLSAEEIQDSYASGAWLDPYPQ